MLSHTVSSAIYGVDVKTVEIDVNVVLNFSEKEGNKTVIIMVGLPDAAVRESKERVWGAMYESGFPPKVGKITISLAPADLRKSGAAYDLPIALGVMCSSGYIPLEELQGIMFIGELRLDGTLRPVSGALPIAMHAQKLGMRCIVVPIENAEEAAAAQGIPVVGCHTLRDVVGFLTHSRVIEPTVVSLNRIYEDVYKGVPDYIDVKGQESAKRAITVAVAGNHNLLLFGPPGTGKSMLAKRIPGIMPPLSMEESLEVTKVYSIAGVLGAGQGLIVRRPFRNPHHTVSDAGLVGGQAIPRPGELSLAHCGVLFLDELPEFRRNVLEVMRQPLENGEVTLSRATGSFRFPARIMLVAAMNPCPCGYYGSPNGRCRCSRLQIAAYRGRISGPLLDRIDMHVEVAPISDELLTARRRGENSASIRAKIFAARKIQRERYNGTGIQTNSALSGKLMDDVCPITKECADMLKYIINELQLSARAYDRILRVARTIADLDGGIPIMPVHISEAANYRVLDRQSV